MHIPRSHAVRGSEVYSVMVNQKNIHWVFLDGYIFLVTLTYSLRRA